VTDSSNASIPPGWYPDNANPSIQRWWDGTQWTEHTQQAYVAGGVAAEQLKAREGTSWNTPWIWLVLFLPLLGLASLFTFNMDGYMKALISNPSRPDLSGALAALFSPAFVIALVLSWVVTALTIFFAYRDYKELEKRGVPKPFHWGFAFLALAGYGIVYPIGRGVVTNRRGAGGLIVTWLAIATLAFTIIVALIWSFALTGQVVSQVIDTVPSR
jgi:hypothetical protein